MTAVDRLANERVPWDWDDGARVATNEGGPDSHHARLALSRDDDVTDDPDVRGRDRRRLFNLLRRYSAVVPKSNPGTEMRSIDWPITRSMSLTVAISSGDMNVNASPD